MPTLVVDMQLHRHAGYESLIGAVGTVTAPDIERLHAHVALAGDARDILAARDSLGELLGVPRPGA